jgi:hypothetical protein
LQTNQVTLILRLDSMLGGSASDDYVYALVGGGFDHLILFAWNNG